MELIHELIDARSGRSVTVRDRPVRILGDETLRAEVAAFFAGPVEVLTPAPDAPPDGRGTALEVLQPESRGWFEACIAQAAAELGLRRLRRFGDG
ncbi:MAG TPA: hypothetical protein VNN74_09960 [Candidatus Micrarchaeia archaeon]|nr:hypothetical protein [Candidatus Micrarchaeia archaeon]